jgi:hypothetical protein
MRIVLFSLAFVCGSASATTISNVTQSSKETSSRPATYSIVGESNDLDIESLKAKIMQRARAFCAKKYPGAGSLPYPFIEISFGQSTVERPYTARLDFYCDAPVK